MWSRDHSYSHFNNTPLWANGKICSVDPNFILYLKEADLSHSKSWAARLPFLSSKTHLFLSTVILFLLLTGGRILLEQLTNLNHLQKLYISHRICSNQGGGLTTPTYGWDELCTVINFGTRKWVCTVEFKRQSRHWESFVVDEDLNNKENHQCLVNECV